MSERASHTRFSVTLTGALLIFLGVAILSNPGEVTAFVVRLAGFSCAVFGAMAFAGHLLRAHTIDAVPFEDILGAGLLLFGGAIVGLFPAFFANVFFSGLGILIVLSGVNDITRSRGMVATNEQEENLTLRIGLVTVAIGVFVTVMPIAVVHAVPILCGIALVLDGLSELFIALKMGREG